MLYRIGDKIRMTTLTWGERITDKKGKPIHMAPHKRVYEGVVEFVGPELAFTWAAEIVRCSGGAKALNLKTGFSFYPKNNGAEQLVEVLNDN